MDAATIQRRGRAVQSVRTRLRTWVRRSLLPTDGFALTMLCATAIGLGALSLVSYRWFPFATLILVVVAGGLLLSVRSMVVLYVVVGGVLLLEVMFADGPRVVPGTVITVIGVGASSLIVARNRWRLGVQGTRGESMLVDLRDRLQAHGELPTLPAGWEAEAVVSPAGGASFSGDFIVATTSIDGQYLELALVDVSGKGVDAGTRALLLSGALASLLGALPHADFLPAANTYLLRQDWLEGFATAIHVVIDLTTGDFSVRSAGHPPAATFAAGSGVWRTVEVDGPLLGVLPDATFEERTGRLHPGDALLIYTDGLVEVPGRDLSVGIDRLLGEAERLVTRGFRDGAHRLVEATRTGHADDKGLVMIWRH